VATGRDHERQFGRGNNRLIGRQEDLIRDRERRAAPRRKTPTRGVTDNEELLAVRFLEAVDGADARGWFSEARTWALRRKRARRSVSVVNAAGSIFTATSRPSFVS
jgi:hypothetical protein